MNNTLKKQYGKVTANDILAVIQIICFLVAGFLLGILIIYLIKNNKINISKDSIKDAVLSSISWGLLCTVALWILSWPGYFLIVQFIGQLLLNRNTSLTTDIYAQILTQQSIHFFFEICSLFICRSVLEIAIKKRKYKELIIGFSLLVVAILFAMDNISITSFYVHCIDAFLFIWYNIISIDVFYNLIHIILLSNGNQFILANLYPSIILVMLGFTFLKLTKL